MQALCLRLNDSVRVCLASPVGALRPRGDVAVAQHSASSHGEKPKVLEEGRLYDNSALAKLKEEEPVTPATAAAAIMGDDVAAAVLQAAMRSVDISLQDARNGDEAEAFVRALMQSIVASDPEYPPRSDVEDDAAAVLQLMVRELLTKEGVVAVEAEAFVQAVVQDIVAGAERQERTDVDDAAAVLQTVFRALLEELSTGEAEPGLKASEPLSETGREALERARNVARALDPDASPPRPAGAAAIKEAITEETPGSENTGSTDPSKPDAKSDDALPLKSGESKRWESAGTAEAIAEMLSEGEKLTTFDGAPAKPWQQEQPPQGQEEQGAAANGAPVRPANAAPGACCIIA